VRYSSFDASAVEWPEYVRINQGRSGSAITTILARFATLAEVADAVS
jgi:hypothetical protein